MTKPQAAVAVIKSAEPLTFEQWLEAVDRQTWKQYLVSVHDLPDMNFRDAFEAGQTPKDFVTESVRDMLEEEGYPLEFLD